MWRKIWPFVLGAPLLAVLLVAFKVYYSLQIWRYDGPDVVFQVRPGEVFSSINHRLAKDKLISNSKIFYRYCQMKNILTKFKTGRFLITHNSNMFDVIDILISGSALGIKITIPEGKNIFEIGKLLESKKITPYKDFIKLAKSKEVASELLIPGPRLEGYLYPDTYKFDKNTPAAKVIRTMVREFHRKTKDLDFSASPSSLSKHEVIILASIVEKETGAKWERPIIAGVFHNRLRKKIRLQSDPTTIYGVFENFNGNLKKGHLRQKTPYNTYRINGLPQGPISNPGLESIKAVLRPDKHNYLYFVSKNDGTHVFSSTYKKHLRAVNKHQKNRKNRKGKSWRNLKQ